MAVIVGSVEPFPDLKPDKAQALKPLEEAAEAFGAWQALDDRWRIGQGSDKYEAMLIRWAAKDVLTEIADTIQACCNLAHALGCDDLTPYLESVETKNRERGRYEHNER